MFALVLLLVLYGVDRVVSRNNEVWRSTSMVHSACELESKYQQTGQFPQPIKDQRRKDHCGWFSKGKPRGDACADIRVHYTSCKDILVARHSSVRIINGTDARRAFPSMAYLYGCSGSVVNNEWLLTAGHCMCGTPVSETVILGKYDFKNFTTDPFKKTVKRIKHVCYDKFNPKDPYEKAIAFDIALEKLEKFEYNEIIQPIKMPPSRDFRYMGPAYAVGYGFTGEPERIRFVKEITLPAVSTEICKTLYPEVNIFEENHVCFGGNTSGGTICNGDSGGPLFICQNYQLVQYGVMVAGADCETAAPAISMRVSTFTDWISKTIQNN